MLNLKKTAPFSNGPAQISVRGQETVQRAQGRVEQMTSDGGRMMEGMGQRFGERLRSERTRDDSRGLRSVTGYKRCMGLHR